MGKAIQLEVESEAVADSGEMQRWPSYSSSSSVSSPSSSSSSAEPLQKMPMLSLNHVSYVCKSVAESVRFYEDVLGFVLVKRPSSFNFEGAWLFNYGIGIHLLESENVKNEKGAINPKDNHISFQCSDLNLLKQRLEGMGIQYLTAVVSEGGIQVDQIFFHDPDGYMVEICNCENLPILPISSCPLRIPKPTNSSYGRSFTLTSAIGEEESLTRRTFEAGNSRSSEMQCTIEVAAMMMENLLIDISHISI